MKVVLLGWRLSCWDGRGPGASFQRGEWDQESRRGLDTFSLPVTHEK